MRAKLSNHRQSFGTETLEDAETESFLFCFVSTWGIQPKKFECEEEEWLLK